MIMKSETKTAVVAACAAATATTSTAATAALLASSSAAARAAAAPWGLPKSPATSLPNRIPRGGHSSAAETETTENVSHAAKEGERRKRKKKRKPRQTTKDSSTSSSSARAGEERGDASAETAGRESSPDATTPNDGQETSSPLPPAAQSILSQTCHYDVLGITKSSTQAEIQKAYRRRCVLTHPDKTKGDRSAFDKVSEAYDVLSCERKRAVYDRFGKDGLEGLENGVDVSGMGGAFGGSSFFGNDVFKDFFGADPFFGRRTPSGQGGSPFRRPPQTPRNRDLRYQLEVTLEELYNGATKSVAIQQPNPLRPHFPYRKEVEVALTPGMGNGQSVRLSGVVDSVPDAAPADVVFLLRERRHPLFTRRGYDLAMEVKISFAESIVGFKRQVKSLDGKTITVGSPFVRKLVTREELVDAPALAMEMEEEDAILADDDGNANSTTVVTANVTAEGATPTLPERITKTTTVAYDLPPSVIQSGDVHVLKGHGMPKRGGHNEYGDLYIQYVVEMPTAASETNVDNLSPEERVELARLLSKLEGAEDPAKDVVRTSGRDGGDGEESAGSVRTLSVASGSDFGRSADPEGRGDEHLRRDEEEGRGRAPHGFHEASDFLHRAFGGGRASGLGGTGGGFHYFSSSSGTGGGGYGHQGGNGGEEEDHRVECNQM